MPIALGIQKSLTVKISYSFPKAEFFLMDHPRFFWALGAFKLRDNGSCHILHKLINTYKRFLFLRNTFTFLSVMDFRYHESTQIWSYFSFSGLGRFCTSIECNITFLRTHFTTLLKACGIQNHSHIFLHQWLMEEYYYPQQAQWRKAQNQTPFVQMLSLLLKWNLPRDNVLNKYK